MTEDVLLLWVMRPFGVIDVMVGTWRGTVAFRDADGSLWPVEYRLTLDADGTGVFASASGEIMAQSYVTWRLLGGGISFRRDLELETSFLGVLPGAIGQVAVERIAP